MSSVYPPEQPQRWRPTWRDSSLSSRSVFELAHNNKLAHKRANQIDSLTSSSYRHYNPPAVNLVSSLGSTIPSPRSSEDDIIYQHRRTLKRDYPASPQRSRVRSRHCEACFQTEPDTFSHIRSDESSYSGVVVSEEPAVLCSSTHHHHHPRHRSNTRMTRPARSSARKSESGRQRRWHHHHHHPHRNSSPAVVSGPVSLRPIRLRDGTIAFLPVEVPPPGQVEHAGESTLPVCPFLKNLVQTSVGWIYQKTANLGEQHNHPHHQRRLSNISPPSSPPPNRFSSGCPACEKEKEQWLRRKEAAGRRRRGSEDTSIGAPNGQNCKEFLNEGSVSTSAVLCFSAFVLKPLQVVGQAIGITLTLIERTCVALSDKQSLFCPVDQYEQYYEEAGTPVPPPPPMSQIPFRPHRIVNIPKPESVVYFN